MQAGWRFAGQKSGARRRADWLCTISAKKAHSFTGQFVEVGCLVFLPSVTSQVIHTQIVSQNENDVGHSRCPTCCEKHRKADQDKRVEPLGHRPPVLKPMKAVHEKTFVLSRTDFRGLFRIYEPSPYAGFFNTITPWNHFPAKCEREEKRRRFTTQCGKLVIFSGL